MTKQDRLGYHPFIVRDNFLEVSNERKYQTGHHYIIILMQTLNCLLLDSFTKRQLYSTKMIQDCYCSWDSMYIRSSSVLHCSCFCL
jgi:hypothetical protein